MSLMRWEPFQDIEKFFEKDFPFMPMVPAPKLGWDMAVDLYEHKGNLIAEMNLPGIDPEKVEVTFQNDTLKIVGKREDEKEIKDKNFFFKEIRRGEFERIVTLPEKVKSEKMEAHYHNGVLKIMMPLVETRSPEKIKVKITG